MYVDATFSNVVITLIPNVIRSNRKDIINFHT